MELELGLNLLVQTLPAIAQIFTAIQEENITKLKHQQAKELQKLNFRATQAIPQPQLNLAEIHVPKLPNTTIDNLPLSLLPSQILAPAHKDNSIPLQILLSPTKITVNPPNDAAQFIPEFEQILAGELREFLNNNYSSHSRLGATDFVVLQNQRGINRESSINEIFELLTAPCLILESEFIGDYLNFRIAYWGLEQKTYSSRTIIYRLHYRKILEASAKSRALKWKDTAKKLLDCGESLEEVNRLGGDNCFNLLLWEKEEKWQRRGIDPSELALEAYKINRQDFEELCQVLSACHCIVAGWVADAYHLFHYNVPPILPKLLPELSKNLSNQEALQEVIKTTIGSYALFDVLDDEGWLNAEKVLNLASSWASLPDKSWAKNQVESAIKFWLNQRGVKIDNARVSCLAAMGDRVTIKDLQYLENLKQCFAALKDENSLMQVSQYLDIIEGLKRQPQLEALMEDEQNITQMQGAKGLVGADIANPKGKLALPSFSLPHTLNGHSGKASAIAISGDNRTMASSSDENIIQVRYLDTGELLHTLQGDLGRILTIALSTDGQILASSNRIKDRSFIKIWHLPTGKPIHTLTGHHKWIYSLAISPDGQTLVSGSEKIKIWQLSTGKLLHTLPGHKKGVYSLGISPDGQTFVSGSGDKTIKIWHLHSGELLSILTGHLDWVRTVAISPDGQIIASGGDDKTIKVWHLGTGKLLRTLTGHSDWVLSVAISPDGETLISGSKDNTIKIWHLSTGKLLSTLTGHKNLVYSLAISCRVGTPKANSNW